MIRNLADLLKQIIETERETLRSVRITHGPTIGEMYEGLTAGVLHQCLPDGLDLKVSRGFATNGEGGLSHEIDCIIAIGDGEAIPYTSKSIFHISKIVATIEVKKTMNPTEFGDAFEKMKEIRDIFIQWTIKQDPNILINHTMLDRAYRGIRLASPPVELHPNDPESSIYAILKNEMAAPLRIIIGYDGWQKEATLRDNLFSFLGDKDEGYGVGTFPNLIISGKNSLVKINGYPYMHPSVDGEWPFMCSTHCNPLIPLLEMLWTKLSFTNKLPPFWGDDQEFEGMTPCLWGKVGFIKGRYGWAFRMSNVKESELKTTPETAEWEPVEIDDTQHTIFMVMGQEGTIDINDARFEEFLVSIGQDKSSFISGLLETGLITCEDDKLVYLTTKCTTCICNGKIYAADNYANQLTIWTAKQSNGYKSGSPIPILRI